MQFGSVATHSRAMFRVGRDLRLKQASLNDGRKIEIGHGGMVNPKSQTPNKSQ